MRGGAGRACAFFDVDGTLITIKSMFAFEEFRAARWPGGGGAGVYAALRATVRRMEEEGRPREEINRAFYERFAGRDPGDVLACARAWFAALRSERDDLYCAATVAALERHRADGIEPVLVSGSSMEILAPLAEELAVSTVLATRVEVVGGRFTGRIVPPQTIGAGKAEAIRRLLAARRIDAAACHAYGDDRSDLPMLEAVAHRHVVDGDPVLVAHARANGWEVLSAAARGEPAMPMPLPIQRRGAR